MAKILILADRCEKCGRCVDICPEGLFVQKQPRTVPRIPRRSGCVGCGHCVSICPAGAVFHEDFPVLEPIQPAGLDLTARHGKR